MIGFFDSGSGGLSVLRAFRTLAPQADIVYFGDVKNAPYGTRSAEELHALTHQGLAFLKQAGATHIVAACNSVSPSILALDAGDIPIIEMSLPTARALRLYDDKRLLLIATPATISSGLYANAIGEQTTLDPLTIPDLARAIEYGAARDEIRNIIREAFASRVGQDYHGIILGCTHYPLVRDLIAEEAAAAFGDVDLIDPAIAVAAEAADLFDTDGTGQLTFHISSDEGSFRTHVAGLFPTEPYEVLVVENGLVI
jgi:glutamate racemase